MQEVFAQIGSLYQPVWQAAWRPYMRNSANQAMAVRGYSRWLQEQAAASNVQNAVDYARTADGWLQSIHNMMGRMGELAVMGNSGILSSVDRHALQYEFSQMQQAIQSITTGPNALAKFNGIPLFQGMTLHSPGDTAIETTDLSAASPEVVGTDLAGQSVTWGEVLSQTDLQTQADAALAAQDVSMANAFLGSVREEVGLFTPYLSESAGDGNLLAVL